MIEAGDFELPEYTLTDVSRRNLEEALELEVSNAEFYFCAAAREDNVADTTMFKRLGKVESEHASTIVKELKKQSPDISRDGDMCSGMNLNNLKESNQRETNTIRHYTRFLGEATEERIKEIFTSIYRDRKGSPEPYRWQVLELGKIPARYYLFYFSDTYLVSTRPGTGITALNPITFVSGVVGYSAALPDPSMISIV